MIGDDNDHSSHSPAMQANDEAIGNRHAMRNSKTIDETRTTTGDTKKVSQRIREALTIEHALAIMLEACKSEAKLRNRVRAAATLEDALDEILDHKRGDCNDVEVDCQTDAEIRFVHASPTLKHAIDVKSSSTLPCVKLGGTD